MRPSILCTLTPDAVALLQLVQSKSIEFHKVGSIDGPEHVVERARAYLAEKPTKRRRALKLAKRGSGKRTINGITTKVYRPGRNMSHRAWLTTGTHVPSMKGKRKAYFDTVVAGMITEKNGKVPFIRRDEAIKTLKAKHSQLNKGWTASAAVSVLYKIGALRTLVR